jgi:hypothetical protein
MSCLWVKKQVSYHIHLEIPTILSTILQNFSETFRRSSAPALASTKPVWCEETSVVLAERPSPTGRTGFGVNRILRTGRWGKPGEEF